MQGVLAAALVVVALLSLGDPRPFALALWTLVVPVGFGANVWRAYVRERAARARGDFDPRKEAKTAYAVLGFLFGAWLVGCGAIALLL